MRRREREPRPTSSPHGHTPPQWNPDTHRHSPAGQPSGWRGAAGRRETRSLSCRFFPTPRGRGLMSKERRKVCFYALPHISHRETMMVSFPV